MKKIFLLFIASLAMLMADFTLIDNQLNPVSTEPIVTESVPEEVVNGDFSTDSVWNKDTGWSISNGTANVDSTGLSNEWLTQAGILTIGRTYTVTFTVSNYTSGSIGTDSWYPDYTKPGSISSNGVHTIEFTAAKTDFAFVASNNTILSIDNVSIKESSAAGTDTATTEPIVTAPVPTSNGAYTIVPGVYGYGTDTRAAYGGTVDPVILHVNTLSKGVSNTDSTHGSFEWAVTRSYPRIVVFDVSGVINCDDKILISDPYLTVAGETAPAPVVLDGSITIFTHDVLFTHFAVRPTHNIPDRDGFAITAYNGPNYNIVIDHCSVSWATDENIQVWTSQTSNLGIHDVTFSNMLIAEGIYDHACGFINSARNIGMVGSILAHNNNRHPFLKVGSETLFWNNIIYNYTYRAAQLSGDYLYKNDPAKLDFRGNMAIAGPNSGSAINAPLVRIGSDYGDNFLQLYMKDNIRNGVTYAGFDVENPVGLSGYEWSSTPLKLPANASSYDSSFTYNTVLSNAGARPAARDAVDARIVNEIKTRTGGGKITAPPAMPKYTELHQAFVPVGNPHEMYDNYYTNLEHQLHQLAAALEQ